MAPSSRSQSICRSSWSIALPLLPNLYSCSPICTALRRIPSSRGDLQHWEGQIPARTSCRARLSRLGRKRRHVSRGVPIHFLGFAAGLPMGRSTTQAEQLSLPPRTAWRAQTRQFYHGSGIQQQIQNMQFVCITVAIHASVPIQQAETAPVTAPNQPYSNRAGLASTRLVVDAALAYAAARRERPSVSRFSANCFRAAASCKLERRFLEESETVVPSTGVFLVIRLVGCWDAGPVDHFPQITG